MLSSLAVFSCTTLPEEKHKWYKFPKNEAYLGVPKRQYKTLGTVREKVEFATLDPSFDENRLCDNYFNKAVLKMLEHAKGNGADAVIEVKSVVFMLDGSSQEHPQAECSDDGAIGQVLVRGIAVKWINPESPD